MTQEVLSKIKNKSQYISIDDSIMKGFYCVAFIAYIIAGKPLFIRIYFLLTTLKRMTR